MDSETNDRLVGPKRSGGQTLFTIGSLAFVAVAGAVAWCWWTSPGWLPWNAPPAASAAESPAVTEKPIAPPPDGPAIYKAQCAGCHGADGRGGFADGSKSKTRDLVRGRWHYGTDMAIVSEVIKSGPDGVSHAYGRTLNEAELNAVAAHVRGLAAKPATAKENLTGALRAAGWKATDSAPPAPVLQVRGGDGQRPTLSDYKGKVVVLYFWGTYCGPSQEQMGEVSRLSRIVPKADVVFLTVCIDGKDVAAADRIVRDRAPHLPGTTAPANAQTLDPWPFESIPATFLIDRGGHVRGAKVGSYVGTDPFVKRAVQLCAAE
jgi:mono/diheme cytochrome c family protein